MPENINSSYINANNSLTIPMNLIIQPPTEENIANGDSLTRYFIQDLRTNALHHSQAMRVEFFNFEIENVSSQIDYIKESIHNPCLKISIINDLPEEIETIFYVYHYCALVNRDLTQFN